MTREIDLPLDEIVVVGDADSFDPNFLGRSGTRWFVKVGDRGETWVWHEIQHVQTLMDPEPVA